jgi:hypothetical protein
MGDGNCCVCSSIAALAAAFRANIQNDLLRSAGFLSHLSVPSRKAPEPEYVVLCSDSIEWRREADLIAATGHPMLLHCSSDRDADFAQQLRTKYTLKSSIDAGAKKFLLWKTRPTPLPDWRDCHPRL